MVENMIAWADNNELDCNTLDEYSKNIICNLFDIFIRAEEDIGQTQDNAYEKLTDANKSLSDSIATLRLTSYLPNGSRSPGEPQTLPQDPRKPQEWMLKTPLATLQRTTNSQNSCPPNPYQTNSPLMKGPCGMDPIKPSIMQPPMLPDS
jgi:hypothetical protein